MSDPVQSLVAFLAIINPFALCLYLVGLMDDLEWEDFLRVLLRAALISLGVFIFFAWAGESVMVNVIGVKTEAMRIFGGVIFFIVGYNYVMKGYKASVVLRGELDELPSGIALPFMIGAGTITQAIIIGKAHPVWNAGGILLVGMVACVAVVILFKWIRDRLQKNHARVFSRHINTLSRLNGLLIGAISTEMVVGGLHSLWQKC